MENFLVPPEDCVILKAFRDTKSLREAALLLGCDPAGLARRVQQISNQFGFLQKVGNRWQLTAQGLDLVAWTEASIQSQKKALSAKSALRLASTMWFTEEVLVPELPVLAKTLGPEVRFSISTPAKSLELALLDGSVDFVVACHPPENPEIEHKQMNQERWCIIAPAAWKKFLSGNQREIAAELKSHPFVRHRDMNPDVFLPEFEAEIMNAPLTIDSLVGVRSAVVEGLGWSFVPSPAVTRYLKNKSIMEVPFKFDVRNRHICVWWLRNRYDSRRMAGKICAWAKGWKL